MIAKSLKYGDGLQSRPQRYMHHYFIIPAFTNGDRKISDDMVTACKERHYATCAIISSILHSLTTQGSRFFESWNSSTISRSLRIYLLGKFYDKEEFTLFSQSHSMKRINWRGVYGNSSAQEIKTDPESLTKRKNN